MKLFTNLTFFVTLVLGKSKQLCNTQFYKQNNHDILEIRKYPKQQNDDRIENGIGLVIYSELLL